jgi:hypothetical protein
VRAILTVAWEAVRISPSPLFLSATTLGTITQDNATGTWSWSYKAADSPVGPTTVTITANDDGGLTTTTTFTLPVNHAAPTATMTGAAASGHSPEAKAIAPGRSVSDPSPVDQVGRFTYAWSIIKHGAA